MHHDEQESGECKKPTDRRAPGTPGVSTMGPSSLGAGSVQTPGATAQAGGGGPAFSSSDVRPSLAPMYRTIDTKFWTDQKIRKLSPHDKLLLLYLITNRHTHVSGLYVLPVVLIIHETELAAVAVSGGLHRLETAEVIRYDPENEVVWVVNMLEYQGRGQKIVKAVEYHLASLDSEGLIAAFLQHYHTWGIKYSSDRVSKPHPSRPSPVPVPVLKKGVQGETGFTAFWTAYPRKTKRQDAAVAWRRLAPDPALVETILAALARHARSDQWTRDGGRFIPHPSTWLHGKRWEDVLDVEPSRRASPLWRGAGRAGASAPAGLRPGAAPDGESVGVQGPADQRGVS